MKGRKRIEVSGRFGMVTVSGPAERVGRGRVLYPVACDCGGATRASSFELRSGKVKSCGCAGRHGDSSGGKVTPEYVAWLSMRSRCYDTNNVGYANYGGRGIGVCDAWRDSFAAFLEHVGRKPSPSHSLDRIDNFGNYEPGNVRWATPEQQNQNKRNAVIIEHDGHAMTIAEWSRKTGIKYATIWRRHRAGVPPEQVFSNRRTNQ